MKIERPSRTAHFAALGRAMADLGLSHIPDFRDPTARVFLNDNGKRNVAKVARAARTDQRGWRLTMALAAADMIGLRTAAIDTAVRDAIAAGARQLVILGAGYDGRAWRMRELSGLEVFEVDHPATQNAKRARVPELPPAIGTVSFVPIDFERESLDGALDRTGHERAVPTCWLWEGVVMYLTREAMRATLAVVAGRSAPGSTLIVNYHTEHRHWFARVMLRLIGEPQISACTPEDMSAGVRSIGFVVHEDSDMTDWNARFAQSQGRIERGYYIRVAVARK